MAAGGAAGGALGSFLPYLIGIFGAYLQWESGQEAAGSTTQASEAQLEAQKEALNYLKQQEAIPIAYRNEARVKLGQLYGLSGDESFIEKAPVEGAKYPVAGDKSIVTEPGGRLPGVSTGISRQQPQIAGRVGAKTAYITGGGPPADYDVGGTTVENNRIPSTPPTTNVDGYELTAGQKNAYDYIKSLNPNITIEQYLNSIDQIEADKIRQTREGLKESFNVDLTDQQIRDAQTTTREQQDQEYLDWLRSKGVSVDEEGNIIKPIAATDGFVNTGPVVDSGSGGTGTGTETGTESTLKKYPEMTSAEVQQQLIDQAMASPLYSHLLSGKEAGEESLLRQQSAIGKLRSGSSAHALYDYNTQLQNNALMQTYNQQLAGLNQMAGFSTDPNAIASLMSGIGATQAAGISGSSQAGILGNQNAINTILGLLGNNKSI